MQVSATGVSSGPWVDLVNELYMVNIQGNMMFPKLKKHLLKVDDRGIRPKPLVGGNCKKYSESFSSPPPSSRHV